MSHAQNQSRFVYHTGFYQAVQMYRSKRSISPDSRFGGSCNHGFLLADLNKITLCHHGFYASRVGLETYFRVSNNSPCSATVAVSIHRSFPVILKDNVQPWIIAWILTSSSKSYRSATCSCTGPMFEDSGVFRWCLEFLRHECGVSTDATS